MSKNKCLLCCFNICVFCGCREKLITNNAFYPPECSYDFIPINNQQNNSSSNSKFNEYEFIYKAPDDSGTHKLPSIEDIKVMCYKIKAHPSQLDYQLPVQLNSSDKLIPVVHVQFTDKMRHRNQVILHSHANSTDLGYMMDSYLDLAHNLRVDILAYDYSGYGLALDNKTTDIEIIQNVLSVYKFAVDGLKYPWNQIILYGQSVGSGPSTFLASLRDRPVGGLILHSSFSSGLKTVLKENNQICETNDSSNSIINSSSDSQNSGSSTQQISDLPPSPNLTTSIFDQNIPQMQIPKSMSLQKKGFDSIHYYDFFPNFQLIKYVNCPIYFMHGSEDNIIPISHMWHLIECIKPTTPYFKQIFHGADHNNIEVDIKYRKQYFHRLRQFLTSVHNLQKEKQPGELLTLMQASYWENFKHIYQNEIQKLNKQSATRTQNTSQSQVSINLVESNHYSQASNFGISERGTSHLSSFSFNPSRNKTQNLQSFGATNFDEDNKEKQDNIIKKGLIISQQIAIRTESVMSNNQNYSEPVTPTHQTDDHINSQSLLTEDVEMTKQLKQDLLKQ